MGATPETTVPSEAPDPEAETLAALDEGAPKRALSVLMQAYGTAVFRFCRQQLADPELAEEAHQMTFVQAYEGLGRFSRRSSLRTWLFSIARHRCLDAAKIARRRRSRFPLTDRLPEAPQDTPGVEDRLVGEARRRFLELCLEELRQEVRAAVLLRFQEDLSYPEMAEVFGDRPATLQARVVRALPVLRRCLEEQERRA